MFAGVNLANPRNLSDAELAAQRQETLDLAAAQAAERDRLIAEGKATQAAENERLSLLTVPDEKEYWGLSEETLNWENPYPKRPGTVPGRYERFDYTIPGSGIAGGGNFAEAFDKAFSSQWKSPVAGLSEMQQQLLGGTNSIGAINVADLAGGHLPPEARAVAEFNQRLRDQQSRHRTYTTNKEYLQAFQTLGIDPSKITSPEALAAISPMQKAAVFDLVQRQLQFKNQRAKRGIASVPFLGTALTIGSAFLPGGQFIAPAVGAGFGGATGGLKGALLGGLSGLGAGHAAGAIKAAGGVKAALTKGITSLAANPVQAVGAGLRNLIVPSAKGVYGTAGTFGTLGKVANVLGSPGGQFLASVGTSLATPLPIEQDSQDQQGSQGGAFSGVTDRISQGMGSLPQAAPSFVDPTPYLGVADLSPAFMNQLELGNTAIPSGGTSLNPAFMNQFELGNTAIPSGTTSLNPAFMNQFELGDTAIPSGVASLDPAFMNQLERAELGVT